MAAWLPRWLRKKREPRNEQRRDRRNIRWNRSFWGEQYGWARDGEEWSDPWGTAEAQWYGSLLPRLRSFLPAQTVLEIAPGRGRWTQFLAPSAQKYYGVDLAANCIEHCRSRFTAPHMHFFVNDGRSLEMIPDETIDLCFSFDSLVHAEIDVLKPYVFQTLRKLTPTGVAFIHHSNRKDSRVAGENMHGRAVSVSAEAVRDLVTAAGGEVLRHEIISWRDAHALDALVLFARRNAYDAAAEVDYNPDFPKEAENIRLRIAPWSFSAAARRWPTA